jgi:small-conductance mechanosensitive channel
MIEKILETIIDSINQLIADFIKLIPRFTTGFIIILLTRYLANVSQRIANKVAKKTLKSKSLQILLKKTAYVTTWIIGCFLASVVAFPGLSLGNVIGALGLGSVAIGFAFQDIFKNFLAGILLLLQEPFSIDDEIIVEGYQGFVDHIDIRTTTIRTYQGEKILIPNATIFTNSVQVRTGFASRRTDLAVGVDYNTSLPKAQKLLFKIIGNVDGVLPTPAPEVDLVNFGDSSIDFVVRYWTLPQQKVVRKVQTKAIVAIKEAFDQELITIPYPIRTLYYYNQEKFNDDQPLSDLENSKLQLGNRK